MWSSRSCPPAPVPVTTTAPAPAKPSSRLAEIDGMRGLLLLIMTLNHLLLWPFQNLSALRSFTHQPLGFVTAAEGFFFVSGLVAALAYGRLYEKGGLKSVWPPLLMRLAQLYFLNLAITFVVVALVVRGADLPEQLANLQTEMQRHGELALALPVAFINMPWLCDILPCYLVYLGVVPLLLVSVARAYRWGIVALSLAIWGFGQLHPFQALAKRLTYSLPGQHYFSFGWFEIAAWQTIFLGAFLIGLAARKGQLLCWIAQPPKALIGTCAAIAALFWVQRHYEWPLPDAFMDRWADVRVLAPLRLLDFACLAVLARAAWSMLSPVLAWKPLTVVGEASLGVFIYHIGVVYFCAWLLPGGSYLLLIAALACTYPVALAWLAFRRFRRRPYLVIMRA